MKKKRRSRQQSNPKAISQNTGAPEVARGDGGHSGGRDLASGVNPDDVLLLTISQTCTLLNLSRSTLDRMAKTDSIPGRIKISGQIRYHRITIEQWLLNQLKS